MKKTLLNLCLGAGLVVAAGAAHAGYSGIGETQSATVTIGAQKSVSLTLTPVTGLTEAPVGTVIASYSAVGTGLSGYLEVYPDYASDGKWMIKNLSDDTLHPISLDNTVCTNGDTDRTYDHINNGATVTITCLTAGDNTQTGNVAVFDSELSAGSYEVKLTADEWIY